MYNYFVFQGYKIELTAEEQEAPAMPSRLLPTTTGPNLTPRGIYDELCLLLKINCLLIQLHGCILTVSTSSSIGASNVALPAVTLSDSSAGQAKPPQQMQQQHAITYVTTIRNRFSNEPETYR